MSRETSRRRDRRSAKGLHQLGWRTYRNLYKPIDVLTPEGLEKIHVASLRVLEEIGMDFLDEEALSILKAAGADVAPGTQRVRFDRGLVLEWVAKAPKSFTLQPRNPERTLTLGDNHINFGSVASAPFPSAPGSSARRAAGASWC